MLQLTQAQGSQEIAVVRQLLLDYEKALGVDLCFQDFAGELAGLPGKYAPPSGRLLLARNDGMPIGCVALQAVTPSRGEMKRLYVSPASRGTGAGRLLVGAILAQARSIGYSEVVLDTLPSMTEAQRLYERFGFRDIPAYRPNPIAGSRYLGRTL